MRKVQACLDLRQLPYGHGPYRNTSGFRKRDRHFEYQHGYWWQLA